MGIRQGAVAGGRPRAQPHGGGAWAPGEAAAGPAARSVSSWDRAQPRASATAVDSLLPLLRRLQLRRHVPGVEPADARAGRARGGLRIGMTAPTAAVEEPARHGPRPLTLTWNSLALIAAKVSTMALGFLFWLAAARLFEPSEVGVAAGLVAAMMLCTQVALLGL